MVERKKLKCYNCFIKKKGVDRVARPKTTKGDTSATTVYIEDEIKSDAEIHGKKAYGSLSAYVNYLIKKDLEKAGK